jgi:hypothetical protein
MVPGEVIAQLARVEPLASQEATHQGVAAALRPLRLSAGLMPVLLADRGNDAVIA